MLAALVLIPGIIAGIFYVATVLNPDREPDPTGPDLPRLLNVAVQVIGTDGDPAADYPLSVVHTRPAPDDPETERTSEYEFRTDSAGFVLLSLPPRGSIVITGEDFEDETVDLSERGTDDAPIVLTASAS